MIKGLALTPPVVGRISIGKVVERNGKRLPEKDDQFTLTTQVQSRDGWLLHPLDETLRQAANGKLRTIPVRLLFNAPDLNLRAEYSVFDRNTGRPLCVGNGETCRRHREDTMETLPCPAPDHCSVGKGICKPYGRLNVIVGDEDDLATFIFRTTGYNSIRTLAARLRYFQAASGDRLSCLALELKLRAKSTTLSHRTPVYYVDLTLRDGMSLADAVGQAIVVDAQRQACGLDQAALDTAAAQGLANGFFEESSEELPELMEAFLPESGQTEVPAIAPMPDAEAAGQEVVSGPHTRQAKNALKDKLDRQALTLTPEVTERLKAMAREVFDETDAP